MQTYITNFRKYKVDGKLLLRQTCDMLQLLGIDDANDRRVISNSLRQQLCLTYLTKGITPPPPIQSACEPSADPIQQKCIPGRPKMWGSGLSSLGWACTEGYSPPEMSVSSPAHKSVHVIAASLQQRVDRQLPPHIRYKEKI
jgi:hypothetical protein